MERNYRSIEKQRLLEQIEREVRETAAYTGRKTLKPEVYEAMVRVPREEFVLPNDLELAYINNALPIKHGQTISQPYIVALMTDLLEVDKDSIVLEVGTGSGYQAAVLGEIVKQVYSLEVIPELGEESAEKLQQLGYDNISVKTGNGREGWPEHAPYDAIIVTAVADELPPALIEQLKPGGHLIIPIGLPGQIQRLYDVEKDISGEVKAREVLAVTFVPLV